MKPWSTLEPNGEMLKEELYEHCQIHLFYMGKDQYATLQRKPFIEQAAPLSIKSMLDPMKIQHINKHNCQHKPMDLVCTSPDQLMYRLTQIMQRTLMKLQKKLLRMDNLKMAC